MVTNSEIIENHFNRIKDQEYGTRFIKADLHFHTPASTDARGRDKYGFNPYGKVFSSPSFNVLKGIKDIARLKEIDEIKGFKFEEIKELEHEVITDLIEKNSFSKKSSNWLLKENGWICEYFENYQGSEINNENIKDHLNTEQFKNFIAVMRDFHQLRVKYPSFKEATTLRDFQDQIMAYTNAKADQIVDTFLDKGLRLVAVTDHNGFGTIWDDSQGMMDLTALTWYEIIDDAAKRANEDKKKGTPLLVLPGVELSVNGVHILAVFPPQNPRRAAHFKICELLSEIKIPLEGWCDNDQVSPISSYDAIDIIHNKGGLAIPAHIDGNFQALLDTSYDLTAGALKNVITNEHLHVVEIITPSNFREEEIKNQKSGNKKSKKIQMEDIRAKKMLPPLAYIQGSDSHCLEDIAKRYTYFKMTEPSYAGLLTAIKMPSSRVRIADSEKDWNGLYLRGIVFDNDPILGDQAIRFNRNLNCICGKLGVGKTTLFNLMKSVVNLEDPGNADKVEEKPLNGMATLFVDRIDREDKEDWDKSATLAQYVYYRDMGERQASLYTLNPDGKPGKTNLGLEDARLSGLQIKFYDSVGMKEHISDEQVKTPEEQYGPFQGFLSKLVGDPADKYINKKLKAFNELFYLPGFLDGGMTRHEKNQLLWMELNGGKYELEMNLKWRNGKAMTNFFELTESQRKTAMLCMILMMGETPVIIDAPEEEFDNEDMTNFLVPLILDCKDTRQILLFTNNPILAVNTDPDNYILIQRNIIRKKRVINIVSGFSIDAPQPKKDMLLEILEGDIYTFLKRVERYEL